MNADCMLRSVSKALNFSRPHELAGNFFLTNDDVLTCYLSTTVKEAIYTYTHAWKNDELTFSSVSKTTVPNPSLE